MIKANVLIDDRQVKELFSPIRSKSNIIILLMKSIKIIMLKLNIPENLVRGYIELHMGEMNRLFFFAENKYFSIVFPFSAYYEEDESIHFKSKNQTTIDFRITSDIISIFLDDLPHITESCLLTLDEKINRCARGEQSYYDELWSIIRDLLFIEDGYLRFDHDPDHQNGHIHPLNHFDVFYSNFNTFKIGLLNKIKPEELLDIMSYQTDCHYLQKYQI